MFSWHTRPHDKARTFRPAVEALEARTVPALTSGEIHINTFAAGPQNQSANASAANGMTAVAWVRDFGGYQHIRAQLYAANGQKIGGELVVAGGTTKKHGPAVALDARGNLVVAWTDGGSVLARRYWATGAARGNTFVVALDPPDHTATYPHRFSSYADPAVVFRPDGSFVVAFVNDWAQDFGFGDAQSYADVYAKLYRADGHPALGLTVSSGRGSFASINPEVACARDGRFAVLYDTGYVDPVIGGASDYHAVVRQYSASATLQRTYEPAFSGGFDSIDNAHLGMDAQGNMVVVAEHLAGTASTGYRHVISAIPISGAGVVGPREQLITVAAGYVAAAAGVAMDRSDGDFVVSWQSWRSGEFSTTIRAAVTEVSALGAVRATYGLGPQRAETTVSISDLDTYLVTYTTLTNRADDPITGIFGRRGLLE